MHVHTLTLYFAHIHNSIHTPIRLCTFISLFIFIFIEKFDGLTPACNSNTSAKHKSTTFQLGMLRCGKFHTYYYRLNVRVLREIVGRILKKACEPHSNHKEHDESITNKESIFSKISSTSHAKTRVHTIKKGIIFLYL